MPLSYDLSQIADFQATCYDIATENESTLFREHQAGDLILNGTTQTLIMLMPAIGQRSITTKNVREVYARIHFLELLHGAMRIRGSEPVPFTLADIETHIGLTTNVADVPRVEWATSVSKNALRDFLAQ